MVKYPISISLSFSLVNYFGLDKGFFGILSLFEEWQVKALAPWYGTVVLEFRTRSKELLMKASLKQPFCHILCKGKQAHPLVLS